jgi:hypothetical protein
MIGIAISIFLGLAWLWSQASSTQASLMRLHGSHNAASGSPPGVAPPQQAQPAPVSKPHLTKVHYADIPDVTAASTSSEKPPVTVATGFPVIPRKNAFAYVFYATADEYACSILVNIRRLNSFHTLNRIIVLLTEKVSEGYKEEFERLNVIVRVEEIPKHPHPKMDPLEGSLLKLLAFKVHHSVDRNIRRVLVLDADQFIYRSLDTLFELPDVDIAAPRAYWIGTNSISTNLMVVSLSDRLWSSVEMGIKDLRPGEATTALINNLFAETIMMLPGQYATVDKHWVDWDMPKHFRPEGVNPEGRVDRYSKAELTELWRVINANVGGNKLDMVPTSPPPPMRKRQLDGGPEPSEKEGMGPGKEEKDPDKKELGPAKKEVNPDKKSGDPDKKEVDPDKKGTDPDRKEVDPDKKKTDPDKEDDLKMPDLGNILNPEDLEREVQLLKDAQAKFKGKEVHIDIPSFTFTNAAVDPQAKDEKPEPPKDKPKVLGTPPKPQSAKPPPYPFTVENHPQRGNLNNLHQHLTILHYMSLKRPWFIDVAKLEEDYKERMHPMLFAQYRDWRDAAKLVCPKVKRKKANPKEGEDDWEWFTFVENV